MALRLDNIFYIYMAVAGLVAGALLVQVAAAREFWIPPLFWIVIAAGLFEAGNALVLRGERVVALNHAARVIGFLIGLAVMVAVTMVAGVTVRFV